MQLSCFPGGRDARKWHRKKNIRNSNICPQFASSNIDTVPSPLVASRIGAPLSTPASRAIMVAGALTLLFSMAEITSVKQTAFNQYTVTWTGNNSPRLTDEEGKVIGGPPSGASPATLEVTDATHYNNVYSVTQEGGNTINIQSWHALYQQSSACCRVPVEGRSEADSSYQLYTPRLSLNAGETQLTITANRLAPQLTYVKTAANLIVAADHPAGSSVASDDPHRHTHAPIPLRAQARVHTAGPWRCPPGGPAPPSRSRSAHSSPTRRRLATRSRSCRRRLRRPPNHLRRRPSLRRRHLRRRRRHLHRCPSP